MLQDEYGHSHRPKVWRTPAKVHVQVIQSEEYRGPKWQVINDFNHGSASNSSSLPQPTLCFCSGSFVSIMPDDLGRRLPNRIAKKRRNGERKEERVEKMQLKE